MAREIIRTDQAPQAIGTYSQAVRVGDTVYLAGQIPLDPATMELVPGDIEAQVRRVFDNLQAVVVAAHGGLGDVAKLNVFLTDLAHFPRREPGHGRVLRGAVPGTCGHRRGVAAARRGGGDGRGDGARVLSAMRVDRGLAGFLAVAAGAAAVAAVLRYQFIEPQALGVACGSSTPPWWCVPREALILAFYHQVPGVLALAGAAIAFLGEGRWATWLGRVAMVLAAMGLLLYNVTWAAPALLLTLMATVRRAPPAEA